RIFQLGHALEAIGARGPVAYDRVVYDARATNLYELQSPGRTLTFYDRRQGEPPPYEVVDTSKDVARPPVPGARVVFPEPSQPQTLWVLPGPLQDRLAREGYLVAPAGTELPPAFYDA